MKIKVSNILPNLAFFYPSIYLLCSMVGLESFLSRLMWLSSLAVLVLDASKKTRSNRQVRLSLVYIIVLAIINAILFGYSYVLHIDCYGYMLLLSLFAIYSNDDRLNKLKEVAYNHRNGIKLLISFYFLLLISILFFNGARMGSVWGLSFPVLYGPYSVTHNIAYQLIIMYAVASLNFRRSKKGIYLIFMIASVLCCVWTVARSGLLALAVVILTDYFSVRKASVKAVIAASGLFVLLYLGLFTDFLTNNPIVQKSIISAQGGSISNGRELFSAYVMNYYLTSTSFIQKLFGVSLYTIRSLLKVRWYVEIHAHNDFVNILAGFGIYGLIGFIYSLLKLVKHTPKGILLLIVLVILSWYNGLYMYVSFVPAIPILMVFYREILIGVKEHDNNKGRIKASSPIGAQPLHWER